MENELAAKSSISDNVTTANASDKNYILVDIGANLTNKKFSRDLSAVLHRAKDAGVRKIIVTGTSVHASKEALRLTRIYPDCLYSTAGVHPHDAKSWDEETNQEIRQIASNPECVAIGECGLDFNRNYSPPEVQLEVFEKQVQVACDLRKPLFLHEREAHLPLLGVLDRYKDVLPPTIIHCFTGTSAEAKEYISRGFYIGITGYIWKDKNEDGLRAALGNGSIPLDRLLMETDAPFMYPNTRAAKLPQPIKEVLSERSLSFLHRYCTFQRNEPCSLPITVETVAAYMGRSAEEVALASTYTALKLFGLS